MAISPLPIFPLNTVLVPGAVLPLRVFESRYKTLLSDVDADPEFGSVLIERGSEVGGGETRMSMGTIAQIISRWDGPTHSEIAVVGTRRFTVTAWLDDAPYPRGLVEFVDEPAAQPGDAERVADVRQRWQRLSDELTRSGERSFGSLDEVASDPALFSFHLAAIAPLGPLDRYTVMSALTPKERLDLLDEMLRDLIEVLQQARGLG